MKQHGAFVLIAGRVVVDMPVNFSVIADPLAVYASEVGGALNMPESLNISPESLACAGRLTSALLAFSPDPTCHETIECLAVRLVTLTGSPTLDVARVLALREVFDACGWHLASRPETACAVHSADAMFLDFMDRVCALVDRTHAADLEPNHE